MAAFNRVKFGNFNSFRCTKISANFTRLNVIGGLIYFLALMDYFSVLQRYQILKIYKIFGRLLTKFWKLTSFRRVVIKFWELTNFLFIATIFSKSVPNDGRSTCNKKYGRQILDHNFGGNLHRSVDHHAYDLVYPRLCCLHLRRGEHFFVRFFEQILPNFYFVP